MLERAVLHSLAYIIMVTVQSLHNVQSHLHTLSQSKAEVLHVEHQLPYESGRGGSPTPEF